MLYFKIGFGNNVNIRLGWEHNFELKIVLFVCIGFIMVLFKLAARDSLAKEGRFKSTQDLSAGMDVSGSSDKARVNTSKPLTTLWQAH